MSQISLSSVLPKIRKNRCFNPFGLSPHPKIKNIKILRKVRREHLLALNNSVTEESLEQRICDTCRKKLPATRKNTEIKYEVETDDQAEISTSIEIFEETSNEMKPILSEAPIEDPLQITQLTETTENNSNNCPSSQPSTSSRLVVEKKINRTKRPYCNENSELILNAIDRLENTVSNIINTTQNQTIDNNKDEFHMFALSIAAQLRQLPIHVAVATQSKIQSILSETRLASLISCTLATSSVIVKSEDVSD